MLRERYLNLLDEIKLQALKVGRLPEEISLVAVTKTHSIDELQPLFEAGCTLCGENRVQELLEKLPQAPENVSWDLIGPLQRNKVKKVVGRVRLIHSVDSLSLAQEISRESVRLGVMTRILLQVSTSGEKSKQGMTPEECRLLFPELQALAAIRIEGLMTMAPLRVPENEIRDCFHALKVLRSELVEEYATILPHLSMGMSNDYKIAITEGATLLRIGSTLFS